MDELLELLGRYDCHLKRDEKSMIDFLNNNFLIIFRGFT